MRFRSPSALNVSKNWKGFNMTPVALILMVASFVCFALATFPPTVAHWNRLVSAGLALWSLTIVLGYSGVLGK
jgi:hypothetical protein